MLSSKPIYYSCLNFSCLKTNPRSLRRVGEGWPGPQALNPLSSCCSDYSQPYTFHVTAQRELAVWAAPRRFHLRPLCPLVSLVPPATLGSMGVLAFVLCRALPGWSCSWERRPPLPCRPPPVVSGPQPPPAAPALGMALDAGSPWGCQSLFKLQDSIPSSKLIGAFSIHSGVCPPL